MDWESLAHREWLKWRGREEVGLSSKGVERGTKGSKMEPSDGFMGRAQGTRKGNQGELGARGKASSRAH